MNKAPWIFSSIAVLSLATAYGCGNGGTGTTTVGTGGSTGTHMASSTTHASATSSHAASTGTMTGTGGAGTGGSAPSVACNPFTGAPCNLATGETCDKVKNGKFACFGPPNDVVLCGKCDDVTTFCKVGTTCIGECTAFCCTDVDCGTGGTCHIKTGETVGVCVASSDAGPDAGSPMAPCNSPAKPPSNGSCYMP